MRLFIGIPLPDGVRKEMSHLIGQLKTRGLPIKWEEEEKLHVTLKFFGEVEDGVKSPSATTPQGKRINEIKIQIEKAIKEIPQFFLKPEKVGYFYKNHLIVWVSVGGQMEVLKKLHQNFEENLAEIGFPKEEREFQGHITIGRGKKLSPQQLKELQKAFFELKLPKLSEFKVGQINLYQSELKPERSRYLIVKKFILGKS